ncbi:helix-turn-helix domain-containing protein [Dapis sp. BLCC M229]|uniref:helix-turn-helix domain-containing protein n=1 Tax=Dapis sp. BLCC M229 TaxID=3400188 RepID=UPI003CE7230B
MKSYSLQFGEKIVKADEHCHTSIRKVAIRFNVSKTFVQKLLKQKKETGHILPQTSGGHIKILLHPHRAKLMEILEKYPDYTLSEYFEYWRIYYQQSVSPSMMCRELQKCNLTIKKTIRSSHSATEILQILRCEYWQKVKNIEAENLVLLDEMGVLLWLT